MVGTVEQFVSDMKRKSKPEGPAGFEDIPISDYETGCLGTSERRRLFLPIADPILWLKTAEALERLAFAFRAAHKTALPAPTDSDYRHERLMVILGLDKQAAAVGRELDESWKREKGKRR